MAEQPHPHPGAPELPQPIPWLGAAGRVEPLDRKAPAPKGGCGSGACGCASGAAASAETERSSPSGSGAAGGQGGVAPTYPVDVIVEASDRQGLLRDISEVFAKEKMNVTGVKTQTLRDGRGGTAWMTFTVEVADTAALPQVLARVAQVGGVRRARRK